MLYRLLTRTVKPENPPPHPPRRENNATVSLHKTGPTTTQDTGRGGGNAWQSGAWSGHAPCRPAPPPPTPPARDEARPRGTSLSSWSNGNSPIAPAGQMTRDNVEEAAGCPTPSKAPLGSDRDRTFIPHRAQGAGPRVSSRVTRTPSQAGRHAAVWLAPTTRL